MDERDLPDFLGGEPAPQDQALDAAAAPAAEAPPAAVEAAPAAEALVEPVAAAIPAAEAPQPVPLATFLDVRDRMNAAEKRARELEAWRAGEEAKLRNPPPDRATDPEGYERAQREQLMGALYDQRLMTSRVGAEVKHGAEAVAKAHEWGVARCDDDPFFNAKVKASPDPLNFVVDEWKREQLLTQIKPEDLEGYQKWKASQTAGDGVAAAPAAAAPAAAPVKPVAPRSISAMPSAGNVAAAIPRDGAATFDAMFPS